LAKTLAVRLQSIISRVILMDQSEWIKGRSTFSNIQSMIHMIAHTEKNLFLAY
jgi:hypothetical protein